MDIILGAETLLTTISGWPGLIVIFIYAILIAFILPTPIQLVLAVPLNLGIPNHLQLALVILLSATGETIGGLLAFKISQGVKNSNYITKKLENSSIDIMKWTESQSIKVAQKWGYAGLAILLCIPFFPDTASIYAISILETNYIKFGAATFIGTVGRLIVTIIIIRGTISLL